MASRDTLGQYKNNLIESIYIYTLIEKPNRKKKIKEIYLFFINILIAINYRYLKKVYKSYLLTYLSKVTINSITSFATQQRARIIGSNHLGCSFSHIVQCLRFKANIYPVMFYFGKKFLLSIYHFMPKSMRFGYSYLNF